MEPHVQRMHDEMQETEDRLKKLEYFINDNPMFNALGSMDQTLMVQQAIAMNTYVSPYRTEKDE